LCVIRHGGGACASEATANKPLLQYHSEPMAFLTYQARYYFIIARSRALFELSHCSIASSSCPTTDSYIQPSRAAIFAIRCSKRNTTQRNYLYLHYPRVCRSRTFFFPWCVSRSKEASTVVRVRRCEAVYAFQLLTLLLARYTSS